MSGAYGFYAGILRFVADRTAVDDPRGREMMAELTQAAEQIERNGAVTIAAGRHELAARAFAGVAGLLQQQILPAAIAEGNADGERQVRWAVDTSMEVVRALLVQAAEEAGGRDRDARVELPAGP